MLENLYSFFRINLGIVCNVNAISDFYFGISITVIFYFQALDRVLDLRSEGVRRVTLFYKKKKYFIAHL